jgi:hypothetical protein
MSLGCYGLAFLLLRFSADKGRPLVEVLPWAALLIILGMCLPLLGAVLGLLSVGDRGPVPKTGVGGCWINSLLILVLLYVVLAAVGGRARLPANTFYQTPGHPRLPTKGSPEMSLCHARQLRSSIRGGCSWATTLQKYGSSSMRRSSRLAYNREVLLPGHQFEMEPLRDGGPDKGDLHHGEGFADANVRPSTEGEVSIFGDVLYPAGSESVGGRPFVNKVWAVYECLHRPVNTYRPRPLSP